MLCSWFGGLLFHLPFSSELVSTTLRSYFACRAKNMLIFPRDAFNLPLWLCLSFSVSCLLEAIKLFVCEETLAIPVLNWIITISYRYLNAIQTNAPHLLRYLATAFIVNKRRRPQFKDFIKVIQQEQYSYKDPITEFLACVYVNYDFDGAQKKMRECEEVSIFFLVTKLGLCCSFSYSLPFFIFPSVP